MAESLRILWLKTGPLHPLDTGGKLRTYHMLRELARHHAVTFLALKPPDASNAILSAASEYSASQVWITWREKPKGSVGFYLELAGNLFSPLPYVISKYRCKEMSHAIAELGRREKHDLIVCDFLTPSVNLFAPDVTVALPTLLFQHNVEAVIWERHVQAAGSGLKRAYFKLQWRRLRDYERCVSARFDGVVAVSPEDARRMRQDYGLGNVLGAVPTGVDVDYFGSFKPRPEQGRLVFVGSMDWMPNIDGVCWFAEEIFPRIQAARPETKLAIVGRRPTGRVHELARKNPAITVTGTVDDVRPYLSQAEAIVVPLRVGGGTRVKIYEAMAAGVPVVSTTIGAEGLEVAHGENILLADEPEDFARQTLRLLGEPALRQSLSQNALRLVRERFGWPAVTAVFAGYCQQIVRK